MVEPLAATRRLLCEMLQQRGFVVGEAADVDTALALLQREPWGLVIFDGTMPEHESLRFCRWVRAQGHALLVALTSVDDPTRLQSLLEAGIDDVLIRPLDHRMAMLRLQLTARRVSERIELLRGTFIPDGVEVTVTRDYGVTANDKAQKLIQKLQLKLLHQLFLLFVKAL